MSWPTYTVGTFFMALLIYDIVTNDWIDVPFHAVIGLVLTGLYMLISMFISDTIAGAALLIPAVALIGFMVSAWMSGESLKSRGCCVRCGDGDTEESEEATPGKSGSGSGSGTTTPGGSNDGQTVVQVLGIGGSAGGSSGGSAGGSTSSDTRASSCPQKLNAMPLV